MTEENGYFVNNCLLVSADSAEDAEDPKIFGACDAAVCVETAVGGFMPEEPGIERRDFAPIHPYEINYGICNGILGTVSLGAFYSPRQRYPFSLSPRASFQPFDYQILHVKRPVHIAVYQQWQNF